jgi:hypothetical protein
MKSNLALQDYRSAKYLSRVREANLGLEADIVVETSANNVRASQRMLSNRDASGLDKSFGEANTFILVTKLSDKAGMNIPLEVSSIQVNITSQFTAFKQRIHTFLCFERDVFVLIGTIKVN